MVSKIINFIKQNKRNIVALVLIILIALVFSINKKERNSVENIESEKLSASALNTTDYSTDTTSLNSGKRSLLKFENDIYMFEYPKGGRIDHSASSFYPNTRVFYFGEKQKVKDLSIFSSNKLYDGYGVLVYNLGKKDAKFIAEKERESHIKECGASKISNLKNIPFADRNAFAFDAKGCKGNFSIYYLNNDNGILIKVVSYYIGNDSYKETLDKILKTFKLK